MNQEAPDKNRRQPSAFFLFSCSFPFSFLYLVLNFLLFFPLTSLSSHFSNSILESMSWWKFFVLTSCIAFRHSSWRRIDRPHNLAEVTEVFILFCWNFSDSMDTSSPSWCVFTFIKLMPHNSTMLSLWQLWSWQSLPYLHVLVSMLAWSEIGSSMAALQPCRPEPQRFNYTRTFLCYFSLHQLLLVHREVNDYYAVTCNPMRNSHHEEECVPLKNGVCNDSDHGNYPGDTHIYLKFHHKVLDHFFCDIFPVIKLSWVDTTVGRKMFLLLVFFKWCNPYESEHHLLCPLPFHYLQDCPANIWIKAFVTGTPPFTLSIGSYGYASIAYLNPKS